MDQVIIFKKTFDQRLEEYKKYFNNLSLPSIDKIHEQWFCILDVKLNQVGWRAFWKIPRLLCLKMNIPYPTSVLVSVNNINFNEFTAYVSVIALPHNIDNLPKTNYWALLKNLYPIKNDPNAEEIADILDQFRFFYKNILMPWNYFQDPYNTPSSHDNLEERLMFYFNIEDGFIPKNKSAKIESLMNEIYCEMDDMNLIVSKPIRLDEKNKSLVNLYLKICDLKIDIDMLHTALPLWIGLDSVSHTWLVLSEIFSLNRISEFLTSVKRSIPIHENAKFKFETNLQETLYKASVNDLVIVSGQNHTITNFAVLSYGGSLKSCEDGGSEVNVISENCALNHCSDNLTLENLTIVVSSARYGIITRGGELTMRNCHIIGQNNAKSECGIVVFQCAKLTMENCRISGFNIGIFANEDCAIEMIDSSVTNVRTCIHMLDNAFISINNCKFNEYSEQFVYFVSEGESIQETSEESGDLSLLLKSNSCVSVNDCTFGRQSIVVVAKKNSNLNLENI